MKKILSYSILILLMNNVLIAQVEYKSYYNSNDVNRISNAIKERGVRYDNNLENLKSLLKWVNELKTKTTDNTFNSAIDAYYKKLKYYIDNNVDLAFIDKSLVNIENGINEEISNYNKRLEEANRKLAEENRKLAEENSAQKIYDKGLEKMKAGNFIEALIDFKRLTTISPDFAAGHFYAGYCYFAQEKYDEALPFFNKAISLEPTPYAYNYKGWTEYYKKNYIQAVQDFTWQIENGKPDDPTGYYNRASAKSELGDFIGAISDYKKAIEIKPDFSMAYNNLGWAYFEKKDYQNALKNVNKSIEIDSENSIAFDSRAEIKFNMNDYNGAISDCNKALELNSKLANSYFVRGRAYYRLGKKEEACQDWSSAGQYGKIEAYDYINKYCK